MAGALHMSPAITARYVFRIAREAKSADSRAAAARLRAKTTTPLVGVSRRWTLAAVAAVDLARREMRAVEQDLGAQDGGSVSRG